MPDFTTSSLIDIELEAAHIVVPILAVLVMLVSGRFMVDLAINLTARFVFRAKGYRTHQTVLLNGEEAVITRIGVWSTHFLVHNGPWRHEFLAVSNTQLDVQEVRILVRKYLEDGHKPPRKKRTRRVPQKTEE